MHKLSITTTIESGGDAVWQLVSDFSAPRFLPFEVLEVKGQGPGATRRIRSPDGLQMVDRLDELDHASRVIRYSLVNAESDPLPITNYQASLRLRSVGGDRTELEWSGQLDVVPGASEHEILPMVLQVYVLGIAGIKAALADGAGRGGARARDSP